MAITVQVQSGGGGGLLTITTVQSDGISFASVVQTSSMTYEQVKGNTTTPATTTAQRKGPSSWTETFTTAIAGTSRSLIYPQSQFAIQVKGTGGAATTWSVDVEVSLNNTDWTSILTHANADGDAKIKWITGKFGFYVRANVTTLTLGVPTNIVVLISSMP